MLLSNGRRLVVALRRTHPELVQCEGEPGGPILASLLQMVHTSSRGLRRLQISQATYCAPTRPGQGEKPVVASKQEEIGLGLISLAGQGRQKGESSAAYADVYSD